jgi:hypothetical protein
LTDWRNALSLVLSPPTPPPIRQIDPSSSNARNVADNSRRYRPPEKGLTGDSTYDDVNRDGGQERPKPEGSEPGQHEAILSPLYAAS